MVGELIDARIKTYMAGHPGVGYRDAYQQVVHDADDIYDSAAEAYRDGSARHDRAEQIRWLEAERHRLAGQVLDAEARRHRRKNGGDYREAFREVALRDGEVARMYGAAFDAVPVAKPRSWQR